MESPDDVIAVLASDPTLLIGQPESQWLEFKSEPYLIHDAKLPWRKLELAKDMSAMANSGGGIIVLGVRTKPSAELQEDVAAELNPFPSDLVSRRAMEDVIETLVFPRPVVHIKDYQHSSLGAGRKLWSLHVERGADRDLPYILAKETRNDQSGALERTLFGLYERIGTQNRPRESSIVHQWLRVGYTADVLDSTHSSRGRGRSAGNSTEQYEEADSTLSQDLAGLEIGPNEAYLAVQFMPLGGRRLQRFFDGDKDSVFDALSRLRQLRSDGFNLPWKAPTEPHSPAGYRKVIRGKGSLSVSPNGLTTTVMPERTLTWAYEQFVPMNPSRKYVLINPLSLPEFVLEACRFFLGEVLLRCDRNIQWEWRVVMGGVEGETALLLPRFAYSHGGDARLDEPGRGRNFSEAWVRGEAAEPEGVAYAMVRAIYAKFGLGETFMMYVDSRNKHISSARIVSGNWRN